MRNDMYSQRVYGATACDQMTGDSWVRYRFCNEGGEGWITRYALYEGIDLLYNDFRMMHLESASTGERTLLEINHCKAGRFECEFADGTCTYLDEDDLALNRLHNSPSRSSFPLAYYRGITVMIDLKAAAGVAGAWFSDFPIDLQGLADRLCPDRHCFVLRETQSIQHIFSELYTVPEAIRLTYMRLKVQELLLFLSVVPAAEQRPRRDYYRKSHMEKVKEIQTLLTGHLADRYTLSQLADRFGMPLPCLKRCFKAVYGMPPHAFVKQYRLQYAARLLNEDRHSVTEAAGLVGYSNVSKFSAAFKAEYGMTPSAYRKRNRMEQL